MKKMQKILVAGLLIFTLYCSAFGQSIKIQRTDVDANRSSVITASYSFGFYVFAEGVKNVNSVSFDLYYDNAQYVRFSQYKVFEFGLGGLYRATHESTTTGEGLVQVGVLSGETLEQAGFDSPLVIYLEFVVLRTAPHGTVVTFNFVNPLAAVFENDMAKIISLKTDPVQFTIHSYIDVWPGDANNDGIVSSADAAYIGYYIRMDSTNRSFRRFKRPNASAYWSPQPVIAWDIAEATYSDCDGNGFVTVTDLLIANLNSGKTHSFVEKIQDKPQKDYSLPSVVPNENTLLFPVKFEYREPYVAASARFSLENLQGKFRTLGAVQGEIFTDNESWLFFNVRDDLKYIEIAAGSFDHTRKAESEGILAYIALEPLSVASDISEIELIEAEAMSPLGYIFPLGKTTSVAEATGNEEFSLIYTENGVFKVFATVESRLLIYNLNGQLVYSCNHVAPGENKISIDFLTTGIYYVVFKNDFFVKAFTISTVK